MGMKKTKYTIAGSSSFPISMLVHEQSIPAREADAHMITLSAYGFTCQIELYRFSSDGSPTNKDRWRSFGWKVVHDEGCEPATRASSRALKGS